MVTKFASVYSKKDIEDKTLCDMASSGWVETLWLWNLRRLQHIMGLSSPACLSNKTVIMQLEETRIAK